MAASPTQRWRHRSTARLVLRVGAALLLAGLGVVLALVAFAVLSPFAGVPVPTACTGGTAGPAVRQVMVPERGQGTVIAADGRTTVAVIPGAGGRTAGGSVHVISGGSVVFSLPVASRAVAAGMGDGRVYVFDDKLGYILGAATGVPLPRAFTVDNYRGLYQSDGIEHVQTSIEIAIIGGDGRPLVVDRLPFGVVVDGCLLATAIAG